jgi:hypothetical protein
MYTDEMRQAFHLIKPPGDFKVDLYDNEQFITIMIDPKQLVGLSDNDAQDIVNYIVSVKKSLEDLGALVLVVREELENGSTV